MSSNLELDLGLSLTAFLKGFIAFTDSDSDSGEDPKILNAVVTLVNQLQPSHCCTVSSKVCLSVCFLPSPPPGPLFGLYSKINKILFCSPISTIDLIRSMKGI